MTDIVFPYPTLQDDVSLVVVGPQLDGEPVAIEVQDSELRTITIRDLPVETWHKLSFDVIAKAPSSELQRDEFGDPQAAISADCKRSNTRHSTPMAPSYGSAGGEWRTTVTLDRDSWFGTVDLSVVISATVDGRDNRIIGRSPSWTLYLDDLPRPPITSAMSVRWVAFAKPDADPVVLREHATEPYYVLLDDDDPTLYLNSSYRGLVGLLADRNRPPGAERALHKATSAQIATSTWQALIVDSVSHVEVDESGDGSDPEPEWPLQPWRQTIVKKLLVARYGSDDDEALRSLVSEWKDPNAAMSLISTISSTAQHLANLPRLLSQSIATLPETETFDEEDSL